MTQTGSGGIFRPYAIGIGTAIAIVAVGFMARSPVANQFAVPRPSIDPVFILLAAAAAAALPAYLRGSQMGHVLTLAIGAALCAFFVQEWMAHWFRVGSLVRRGPVNWKEVALRRDLAISFFAVAEGTLLSLLLGKQ